MLYCGIIRRARLIRVLKARAPRWNVKMRDYKRHVWRLESARWTLIIRDYSALPFCYKRRAIDGVPFVSKFTSAGHLFFNLLI